MQTNNLNIKALVSDLVVFANNLFVGQNITLYLMGSLARGGFSEISSDIDIGIMLDTVTPNTQLKINKLVSITQANHPNITNKISIFWGSIDSINGHSEGGRYPPFDRLDLIKSAVLLYGSDVRDELFVPTKEELEVSCAEFALQYLSKPNQLEMFRDASYLVNQGAAVLSKAILFPARFIYLASTDEISINEASAQYYVLTFKGDDSILVEKGYQWRMEGMVDEKETAIRLVEKGLRQLYNQFLDIYMERLTTYNKLDLVNKLSNLKNKIKIINLDVIL